MYFFGAVDFLNALKKYIMYLQVMVGENYWYVMQVHNVFHYVPITRPPPPTALLQNIQQGRIKYIICVSLNTDNEMPTTNTEYSILFY